MYDVEKKRIVMEIQLISGTKYIQNSTLVVLEPSECVLIQKGANKLISNWQQLRKY